MPKYIQLFDNSFIELPDDTPDEVVNKVAHRETYRKKLGDRFDAVYPQMEKLRAGGKIDLPGKKSRTELLGQQISGQSLSKTLGDVVDVGANVLAVPDFLLAGATGLATKAAAGYAGAATASVSGGDAGRKVQKAVEESSYQPRTSAGKATMEGLGKGVEWLGKQTAELGGGLAENLPILGLDKSQGEGLGQLFPELALDILTLGGAGAGARAVKSKSARQAAAARAEAEVLAQAEAEAARRGDGPTGHGRIEKMNPTPEPTMQDVSNINNPAAEYYLQQALEAARQKEISSFVKPFKEEPTPVVDQNLIAQKRMEAELAAQQNTPFEQMLRDQAEQLRLREEADRIQNMEKENQASMVPKQFDDTSWRDRIASREAEARTAQEAAFKASLQEEGSPVAQGPIQKTGDIPPVVPEAGAGVPEIPFQTGIEKIAEQTRKVDEATKMLEQLRKEDASKAVIDIQQKRVDRLNKQLAEMRDANGLTSSYDTMRPLYEREASVPVQKTRDFRKGPGKKQGGAIDPSVFLDLFPSFRNSKIVDSLGALRVMYHGTSKDTPFKDFKANKRGTFLTPDPEAASSYAMNNDSQGFSYEGGQYVKTNTASRVMPVYVNAEKVYTLTPEEASRYKTAENYSKFQREIADKARAGGYDAIEYPGGYLSVLDTKNIKSALSPDSKPSVFTGPGKNQRGAIGVDPKKAFKDFEKKLSPALKPHAKELWAKVKEREQQLLNTPVSKTQNLESVKVPGLQKAIDQYGVEASPWDSVKEKITQAPDIDPSKVPLTDYNLFQNMIGGQMYAFVTQHPLLRWTQNHLFDATKNSDKYKQELVQKGVVDRMNGLSRDDRMAVLNKLVENDRKGVDDLTGLSPKASEAYNGWRTAFNQLLDNINKTRELQGKKPIKSVAAYFPHIFGGNYRAFAVVDGKLISVISEKSKARAQQAIDYITADYKKNNPDGPALTFTDIEHKSLRQMQQESGGKGASGLHEILQIIADESPEASLVSNALKAYLDSKDYTATGQFQHLKRRRDDPVGGYQGNKPWLSDTQNYKEALEGMMYHLESGFKWAELQRVGVELNKALADEKVLANQKEASYIARQMVDSHYNRASASAKVINNLVDFIPGATKGLTNSSHIMQALWLGFMNIPYLASQLYQTLQTAPRAMSVAKAGGDLGVLMPALSKGIRDFTTNFIKKDGADAFTKEAMQYAKDFGVISSHYIDDVRGVWTGKMTSAADKIAYGPIQMTESITRGFSFFILARTFKELGMNTKQALDAAYHATDISMVNYRPHERAGMYQQLGVAGAMISRLRTYTHNQYGQLAGYAKHRDYASLLTMLGLQLAGGGILGMYGMDTVDMFLKMAGMPTVREFLIRKAPETVAFGGVSSLSGVDMSSKLSAANLLPENVADIAPYLGGAMDLVQSGWDAVWNYDNEEKTKRFLHELMPAGHKGITEKAFFTNEAGVFETPKKSSSEGRYRRSEKEEMLRYIGGRSLEESKRTQLDAIDKQNDKRWANKRNSALEAGKDAIKNRDSKLLVKNAQKYVDNYGEVNTFLRELEEAGLNRYITNHERNLLQKIKSNPRVVPRMLEGK